MPNVKRAQLMKSFDMKKKDFEAFLDTLGIKKTGGELEIEELDVFLQKITLDNQIGNLADYLSGKATLVVEGKEKPAKEEPKVEAPAPTPAPEKPTEKPAEKAPEAKPQPAPTPEKKPEKKPQKQALKTIEMKPTNIGEGTGETVVVKSKSRVVDTRGSYDGDLSKYDDTTSDRYAPYAKAHGDSGKQKLKKQNNQQQIGRAHV